MNPCDIAAEELVPHAGNMVLIDQLDKADEESAQASLLVKNEGLFSHAPDMPAWVGVEYMAQTIAAWAGFRARQAGDAPRIGFLIGTRKYQSHTKSFRAGQRLRIRISKAYQDGNGMASFDSEIVDDSGTTLVAANLNVFQPDDEQIKEMMEATND